MQTIAPSTSRDLSRLSEQIGRVLDRARDPHLASAATVTIAGPDGPRLARGIVHEWFSDIGAADPDAATPPSSTSPPPRHHRRRDHLWLPPLCILSCAAAAALLAMPAGWVLWIGRRCWPTPHTLIRAGDRHALRRSIFIDPPDDRSRLAAIDLALRCPAAAAVVADASRTTMAASRRLQVAAGGSTGLMMLARPAHEFRELSAAAARWTVRRNPTDRDGPGWTVDLLRCKGVRPANEAPRSWTVEWSHHHHGTGALALSAAVARGPGQPPRPSETATPTAPPPRLRTA